MNDYLLNVWGKDQEEVAALFPPDKINDGTLCYWFATHEEREKFRRSLDHYQWIMRANYDPADDEGNATDTHKRTVAIITLHLPDGRQETIERDFGYGYPHSSAEFMFTEGNYCCDCNRASFLGLDMDCGNTIVMEDFRIEERD